MANPYRTKTADEMMTSDAMLDALDAMIDEALSHVPEDEKRERLKRAFAGQPDAGKRGTGLARPGVRS